MPTNRRLCCIRQHLGGGGSGTAAAAPAARVTSAPPVSAGPAAGHVLFGGPLTRAVMIELLFMEAGIPVDVRKVNMGQQEHQSAEYKALTGSATGLIPTLVTPDGEALYETPAIMLHLADRHQLTELAPGVDDPDRGRFLSALFFIAGELHPHMKRHWYPSRYVLREEDEAAMAEQARQAAFERVQDIESRIEENGGPYQLGTRFSLLDICLAFFCLPGNGGAVGVNGLLEGSCPRVLECVRLVLARPRLKERFEHYMYRERAEFNAMQQQ